MSLTPNEIRNHQFPSTLRGYSKEEVETFREEIATALEESLAKIGELTEKYQRLDERYKTLSDLEDALKMAKTESEKNAQAVLEISKSDAKKIVLAAEERGEKILEDAERKITETNRRFAELLQVKDSYRDSVKSVIAEHLKRINELDSQLPELTKIEANEAKDNSPEIRESKIIELENDSIENTESKKIAPVNQQDSESQNNSAVENNKSNAEKSSREELVSAGNRDSDHSGPKPGDDGIIVFGRKDDRNRSPEENAKILSEIDSVVDKFAPELTS